MRIRVLTVVLSGALGLGVGLIGASLAASSEQQASVSVESCHHADSSAGRSATFVASVRATGGTRSMGVRLDLQRRREKSESWRTVHAAGLGEWHRSEPGVDIFRYRKLVTNLAGAASYRAVARFRWYGPGGAVIRRAKRVTGTCRQPDPRPDLLAADLTVQPGASADRARYVVTLRNRGREAAGAFNAIVYVDGRREGSLTVPELAGRTREAITVEGKRCGLGSSVLVVLDPDDEIDESRESNNTTRFACPL
jgi:hypothetical protein